MSMLDSLVLTLGVGTSYGSGTLKALQNENLPKLDLLVREAIQNSNDAAFGIDSKSVKINFNLKTFKTKEFNAIMTGLTEKLNERFPEESADYMEIRDSETSGLTGPVSFTDIDPDEDDHGNYLKLVFETGKEQTATEEGDAGGRWGYGKSVYYQVGIGIVVFYSRIHTDDGKMESRLIVSMVERETDRDSMLRAVEKRTTGRAWWGVKEPGNEEERFPLTDESEIEKVLSIFGIERFDESSTGTSIIIPYIDKQRLLDALYPDDIEIDEAELSMCKWKDSVEDYLKLAIEKWYAPKVFNKNLGKYGDQKWLGIRINSDPLTHEKIRPYFRLVQELYTTALSANKDENAVYSSEEYPGIRVVKVKSARISGQDAGHAAYIRIKKEDIESGGTLLSPYLYLRIFNRIGAGNEPIVMFARKPGMILDYKIDGPWVKGLPATDDENEYLFVFYVPKWDAKLKDDKKLGEYSDIPFGEYLRSCEKSDHMEWEEPHRLNVVSNIQRYISRELKKDLKEIDDLGIEGSASKLSGKLGRRLLPRVERKTKIGGGGSGTGGGGTGGDNFELSIENGVMSGNTLAIPFSVKFKNIRKKLALGIFIETETSLMDADSWADDIGTAFPISIIEIRDAKIVLLNSESEQSFEICNHETPVIKNDYSSMGLLHDLTLRNDKGFFIENKVNNAIVSGVLVMKTADRKYCCTIKESKDITMAVEEETDE